MATAKKKYPWTVIVKGKTSSYCSGISCRNSRQYTPGISFFRFPKDNERSKRWVINSRRQDLLDKPADHLYVSNVLCEYHFEDSQFMNAAAEKKSLIKSAVPTLFDVTNPPKKLTLTRPQPKIRNIPVLIPSGKPTGQLSASTSGHKMESSCEGDGTTCLECGKTFSHAFYFRTHIETHATEKSEPVVGQCGMCGIVFFDQALFSSHMISVQSKLDAQAAAEITTAIMEEIEEMNTSPLPEPQDTNTTKPQSLNLRNTSNEPQLSNSKKTSFESETVGEPRKKKRKQEAVRPFLRHSNLVGVDADESDPALAQYLQSLSEVGLAYAPSTSKVMVMDSKSRGQLRGSRSGPRGSRAGARRGSRGAGSVRVFGLPANAIEEYESSRQKKPSPKYEYLDEDIEPLIAADLEMMPKSGKQSRGERLRQRQERVSQDGKGTSVHSLPHLQNDDEWVHGGKRKSKRGRPRGKRVALSPSRSGHTAIRGRPRNSTNVSQIYNGINMSNNSNLFHNGAGQGSAYLPRGGHGIGSITRNRAPSYSSPAGAKRQSNPNVTQAKTYLSTISYQESKKMSRAQVEEMLLHSTLPMADPYSLSSQGVQSSAQHIVPLPQTFSRNVRSRLPSAGAMQVRAQMSTMQTLGRRMHPRNVGPPCPVHGSNRIIRPSTSSSGDVIVIDDEDDEVICLEDRREKDADDDRGKEENQMREEKEEEERNSGHEQVEEEEDRMSTGSVGNVDGEDIDGWKVCIAKDTDNEESGEDEGKDGDEEEVKENRKLDERKKEDKHSIDGVERKLSEGGETMEKNEEGEMEEDKYEKTTVLGELGKEEKERKNKDEVVKSRDIKEEKDEGERGEEFKEENGKVEIEKDNKGFHDTTKTEQGEARMDKKGEISNETDSVSKTSVNSSPTMSADIKIKFESKVHVREAVDNVIENQTQNPNNDGSKSPEKTDSWVMCDSKYERIEKAECEIETDHDLRSEYSLASESDQRQKGHEKHDVNSKEVCLEDYGEIMDFSKDLLSFEQSNIVADKLCSDISTKSYEVEQYTNLSESDGNENDSSSNFAKENDADTEHVSEENSAQSSGFERIVEESRPRDISVTSGEAITDLMEEENESATFEDLMKAVGSDMENSVNGSTKDRESESKQKNSSLGDPNSHTEIEVRLQSCKGEETQNAMEDKQDDEEVIVGQEISQSEGFGDVKFENADFYSKGNSQGSKAGDTFTDFTDSSLKYEPASNFVHGESSHNTVSPGILPDEGSEMKDSVIDVFSEIEKACLEIQKSSSMVEEEEEEEKPRLSSDTVDSGDKNDSSLQGKANFSAMFSDSGEDKGFCDDDRTEGQIQTGQSEHLASSQVS